MLFRLIWSMQLRIYHGELYLEHELFHIGLRQLQLQAWHWLIPNEFYKDLYIIQDIAMYIQGNITQYT